MTAGAEVWSQEWSWSFQNRDDMAILFAKRPHSLLRTNRKSSNLIHLRHLVFEFFIVLLLPIFLEKSHRFSLHNLFKFEVRIESSISCWLTTIALNRFNISTIWEICNVCWYILPWSPCCDPTWPGWPLACVATINGTLGHFNSDNCFGFMYFDQLHIVIVMRTQLSVVARAPFVIVPAMYAVHYTSV